MTGRRGSLWFNTGTISLVLLPLMMGQGCPLLTAPQDDGVTPVAQDITPANAYAMIQQRAGDPTFVILDVRTPQEFAAGHIEGAVNVCILLCTTSFDEAIANYDKSATYLVYCGVQHRSPIAATAMLEQGFANVYDMSGGLTQWQAEGLPVVQ